MELNVQTDSVVLLYSPPSDKGKFQLSIPRSRNELDCHDNN